MIDFFVRYHDLEGVSDLEGVLHDNFGVLGLICDNFDVWGSRIWWFRRRLGCHGWWFRGFGAVYDDFEDVWVMYDDFEGGLGLMYDIFRRCIG